MKILLATDGSPCSETAVKNFTERPWPTGSEVEVFSVVEPPIDATPEANYLAADYFQEAESRAEAAVQAATAELTKKDQQTLKITTKVVGGSPKRAIVDEAQTWGADLIVLGSHGHRGIRRFLLGSVSDAVSLHAPCSVEIVREHCSAQAAA